MYPPSDGSYSIPFGAGPQQQQYGGQQLSPQEQLALQGWRDWLSKALTTAAPVVSMIPGVGPILGPAAGAAGGFGQATGLFGAGPQQQYGHLGLVH
jgi:hypothetical protein